MGGHAACSLFAISIAALTAAGCENALGPGRACAPGRQVECACGGGNQGHQLCRSDGSGFGACLGCELDGAVQRDARVDEDGGIGPSTDAALPDAWTQPDAWTAPDAWTDPDTGPPIPSCAWVWLDRSGPAFQPHACRPGAGVVDGMLVDPMAFFSELVAGRDPESWESVMNEIESELWSCGVGQQRGSGGDVRGRLFLPTATCPDASPPPGDTAAIFLGVRQESDCWSHPADVVDCR